MSELSPVLAGWRDTQVAMPGVPALVTIAKVKEQVVILPTKTKPKKLVFLGSDGKTYTYLFKGKRHTFQLFAMPLTSLY